MDKIREEGKVKREEFENFIKAHREDNPRDLALQASRYPDIDMRAAVVQISGWQIARKKLPLWAETEGILFPEHLSMEQCSSQLTAEYKAILREKGIGKSEGFFSFTDLTAGFGVDATMMARRVSGKVTLVERNAELCDILRHNLPLLGVEDAEVVCGDGTEVLTSLSHQSLIFLDPARRDSNGGKTVAISDCTPDVSKLQTLLMEKADVIMVKLSPMLDLASVMRELQGVAEIHIVSVEGECKEVIVILKKDFAGKPLLKCVNINKDGTICNMTADEENALCTFAEQVGQYIYEPNASIMKACVFKSVSQQYGVDKLHPSSHLYTSGTLVEDFPGRCFKVEAISSFGKKELKGLVGDVKKANLTVRNFPATVAELRKRLKLAEGGDIYLFATTLADGSKVIIKGKKAK